MAPRFHSPTVLIQEAVSLEDIDAVRILFRAYAQSIAHVHCFPDFEEELAQLHIAYASPGGGLRLALVEGQPAGCCAFRPLPDTDHANACEMKRLFVAPSHRGLGLGLRLVESVMDAARIGGYSCMLLDTLSEMEAARQLYDEIGFVEIAPYMQSPIPGAHHLKVTL